MKRVAEGTWRDAGYKSYGDKRAIIESLVIKHLNPRGDSYICMEDVVQHYTEEHLSYDTSKPLSNGMYLHWDDDAYEWSLKDTPQEE